MKLTREEQKQKIRDKGEATRLLGNTKRVLINNEVKYFKKNKAHHFKFDKIATKVKRQPKKTILNTSNSPYKTKAWKSLRLRALTRDDFKCTKCGRTKKLHVHHIEYDYTRRNHLIVPLKKLITLCNNCHEIEHGFKIG